MRKFLLHILSGITAAAVAAAIYVWLVGPIEWSMHARPIHWSTPRRPLLLAAACLVLRLLAPLAVSGWRRVRSPVRALLLNPFVWVPLILVAVSAWPVARHRAFARLADKIDAERAEGHAQISLATRPVLGATEMSAGVVLPAEAAGRELEVSCGLPVEASDFLQVTGPPSQVVMTVGATTLACDLEPGRWSTVRGRLADARGQEDRMAVEVTGPEAARAARLALVSRPRLLPRPDPARSNLVLISLDTLRADHLGVYGYHRPVSPHIDRLAREGTLFERAISQAPWTTPSHMSLFTSLFPSAHAVDSPTSVRQRRLGDDRRTLAEILGAAGYATGAFTGSGSISAIYGFWRGFDVYDETDKDDPARHGEDISGVFDKASRWLVAHRDGPFFLFFHSYEAHAPFVHGTFLDEVPADAGPSDPRRLTALYDGDILYADGFIGQLLALLDGLGLAQRTIVVLLSDHGEELVPRYPGVRFGHGHTLYDELLHVPLIIRHSGSIPAGLRVPDTVQVIDVMPTLLQLMGLPPPPGMQGASFARAFRGEPLAHRAVLSEATNYGPDRKALLDGRFKYIKLFPRTDKPAREIPVTLPDEELFDLGSDPDERHSDLGMAGAPLDQLRRELQSFVEINMARRHAGPDQPLDDETIRRLKALGYIQ